MDFLNAVIVLCNFVIIPATAYGCQLALGALGLTLVYGILRFSNFAHGDIMAFGTMITILVTSWLQASRCFSWGSADGAARLSGRNRRHHSLVAGHGSNRLSVLPAP